MQNTQTQNSPASCAVLALRQEQTGQQTIRQSPVLFLALKKELASCQQRRGLAVNRSGLAVNRSGLAVGRSVLGPYGHQSGNISLLLFYTGKNWPAFRAVLQGKKLASIPCCFTREKWPAFRAVFHCILSHRPVIIGADSQWIAVGCIGSQ